ncbi:hypothetical protein BU26DRAFT_569821 [Trematosphaeria pertusa]|uniref:Uncharacterized protein n=1 Tax=Trematosphaeria pertusa TaxID=390896 RepID=A0A6A6I2X6_9PLEO|nr:uncharacterized protein BU26DRAFT_569821 [Trematosphaeria pertusa]KAF2243930.1 hypothetical protein BU26DRAFT_569821 [Trematosphaeria pertusa]
MPQLHNRMKYLPWTQRFIVRLYPPPVNKLRAWKGEYRYQLKGPPRQNDPVLRLIHRTIKEVSKEDMVVSAAGITVHNLSPGPPIWPLSLKNAQCPIKLYAVKQWFEEFPSVLPVSVIDRGSPFPLTVDKILVEVEGKWKPFKEWLSEFPDREWLLHKPHAAQRKWWTKNGKAFPIMQLPKELREIILKYVLGGEIRPHVNHFGEGRRVILGTASSNNPYSGDISNWRHGSHERKKLKKLIPHPNYAIFCVSKTIYEEAMYVGWGPDARKHFINPEYLKNVLLCPTPPAQPNWLTKLKLEFSIQGYFSLLGVEIFPTMWIDESKSLMHLIKGIKTLVDLDLQFNNPYENYSKADRNPWLNLSYNMGPQFGNQYDGTRRVPCHKIIADWILTFLFPHIKYIPRIRLTGCIKTCVLKKWDYILLREYIERKWDYRTHGYDWGREMELIMSLPQSALPPQCFCPLSCDARELEYRQDVWLSMPDSFDRDDEYTSDMDVWPPSWLRYRDSKIRRG